jgi:hypothetical protein
MDISSTPDDRSDEISYDEAAAEAEHDRDRDGIDALRDVEAEAGDEESVGDGFDLDTNEARDLGVALDRVDDEPRLD